jgi:hypothetical protein
VVDFVGTLLVECGESRAGFDVRPSARSAFSPMFSAARGK